MNKPRSSLPLLGFSGCIVWLLLAPAPAHAQLISDEAARVCAQSTADETITSCTAVIDSGSLTGRQLAAAYAQQGDRRAAKASLNDALSLRPDLTLDWLRARPFSLEGSHTAEIAGGTARLLVVVAGFLGLLAVLGNLAVAAASKGCHVTALDENLFGQRDSH